VQEFGPQSLQQPSQTIGLGMHGREKQHVGCPHGPQGVQQQPLPNNETDNKVKPSQRAIMALFHLLDRGGAAAAQSRTTRPYLSAGKVGPIEKIAIDGKFCRSR
jgi:hypothetical protein